MSCYSDEEFICCHIVGCSKIMSIRDNTNREHAVSWGGDGTMRDEDTVYGIQPRDRLLGESELFESSTEAYGFMLGHLERKRKQHIDKINAMHDMVVENSKIILDLSQECALTQEKDGIFRDQCND